MTALERAIADAVAKAKANGLEPKSIYLRPEDIDELGGVTDVGGLAVRRTSGKARHPTIYCRHGIAVAVSLRAAGKTAPRLKAPDRAYLMSLLNGFPVHDPDADRRLRGRGLVASRVTTRRLKGKSYPIEEPRLTGAGETEARRLWDALDRAGRATFREAALKAGLDPAPVAQPPR